MMSKAQDPFYIVKEEIQDSQVFINGKGFPLELVSKLISLKICLLIVRASNGRWMNWTKQFRWQLEILLGMASMKLSLKAGGDGPPMLVFRVADVKKAVVAGKENDNSASAICRELMRLPNSQQPDISDHYSAKDNDDFIASESDRQMLLIKQQDEELDELSASVQRIGGVGLTIHEELLAQEKILDDLGTEMDSTKNRLDFVQVILILNLFPKLNL